MIDSNLGSRSWNQKSDLILIYDHILKVLQCHKGQISNTLGQNGDCKITFDDINIVIFDNYYFYPGQRRRS